MYLPYYDNTYDSLHHFLQCLAQINAIVQEASTSEIIVVGDFNADPHKRFGVELLAFADKYHYKVSDIELHGRNSYFCYVC